MNTTDTPNPTIPVPEGMEQIPAEFLREHGAQEGMMYYEGRKWKGDPAPYYSMKPTDFDFTWCAPLGTMARVLHDAKQATARDLSEAIFKGGDAPCPTKSSQSESTLTDSLPSGSNAAPGVQPSEAAAAPTASDPTSTIEMLERNGFIICRKERTEDDSTVLSIESEHGLSIDVYPSGVHVVCIQRGPDKGLYEFDGCGVDGEDDEDMLFVLRAGRGNTPPASETPTPLTDAHLEAVRIAPGESLWASASFARELERRLAASESGAAALREALWKADRDIFEHLQVARYNLTGMTSTGDQMPIPNPPILIHSEGIAQSDRVREEIGSALATHAGAATLKELQELRAKLSEMQEQYFRDADEIRSSTENIRKIAAERDNARAEVERVMEKRLEAMQEAKDARAKLAEAEKEVSTLKTNHCVLYREIEDANRRITGQRKELAEAVRERDEQASNALRFQERFEEADDELTAARAKLAESERANEVLNVSGAELASRLSDTEAKLAAARALADRLGEALCGVWDHVRTTDAAIAEWKEAK